MCKDPISPTSPWYYFSPEGIGSLAYREWMGKTISAEDVRRVVDANPQSVSDGLLASFVARVSAGDIGPYKRFRGRPTNDRVARLLPVLQVEYEDRLRQIHQRRRDKTLPGRLRSDPSPCHQAAEEVARHYKLDGGRALLNHFSLARRVTPERRARFERSRAFFMKEKQPG